MGTKEIKILIFLTVSSYVICEAPTCPEGATGIVFYPDPDDCSKYYECFGGIRNHMLCPPHLYWSTIANACDYLPNVDCGNRPVINPTSDVPTTVVSSTPTPTTPSYDPDPQCHETDVNITFYPDPSDCKQYFECNRGKRFIILCPDDLLYNVNEEACDYPEHVTCYGRSTPTHTTLTDPSTTPIPSTVSTTPNYDPDPKCPDNETITFFPDPSDCKQFFECNRGVRFTILCPRELLYNVDVQACDYPEHVNCQGRSTPVHTTITPTTTTEATTTPRLTTITIAPPTTTQFPTTPNYDPDPKCPNTTTKNVTFFPDPSDCKQFFECNRGVRFTILCPDELLYNVDVQACDYPKNVDCQGRSTPVHTPSTAPWTTPEPTTPNYDPDPKCPDNVTITFFPDPSDCKQFFECNRGVRFTILCPRELLYNARLQACDYPEHVDCQGRSTPVHTPSTGSTTPLPPLPYNPCAEKEDGDYAGDPRDCKIFYECERHTGIERYCKDNLYWCQEEMTCDYLNKPGCTCYRKK